MIEQNLPLSVEVATAIEHIKTFMQSAPAIVVAFSGGMDSSLLAILAQKFVPEKFQVFLVVSEFMPETELSFARSTAAQFNLVLKEVRLEVLCDQVVAANDKDRCYYCKKAIFNRLQESAGKSVLCEGSVTDDDNDYRPGKRALKELGIRSPLLEAGFSKKMVAEALVYLGGANLVRPAQSCLATRIVCNTVITRESLQQIEQGEKLLRDAGLTGVRLRHHGEVARLEVKPGEQHKALDLSGSLSQELKLLGFKHICIDVDGYNKGSMNRLD